MNSRPPAGVPVSAADPLAQIAAGPGGPEIGAFFDLDGTLIAGFTASSHAGDRIRWTETESRDTRENAIRTVARERFQVSVAGGLGPLVECASARLPPPKMWSAAWPMRMSPLAMMGFSLSAPPEALTVTSEARLMVS